MVSCSDIVLDESTVTNQNVKNELVAYPMRNHATRAGVTSDVGDWESWEKVKIAELEEPVRTPWNETGTSGAIPNEIRKDIKYKDGWNLIAHTVNGKGEKGLNYLIFYNRYTGILKGFYHSSDNIPNNTGIWHLHFEQPQSFLAFSNPIAELSSARTKNDIYIVNVTQREVSLLLAVGIVSKQNWLMIRISPKEVCKLFLRIYLCLMLLLAVIWMLIQRALLLRRLVLIL